MDVTIATNAAPLAASGSSEIAMPVYSPETAQLNNSIFPPKLSIAFLAAASRATAFSFRNPLAPSALYLNSERYLGMWLSLEREFRRQLADVACLRPIAKKYWVLPMRTTGFADRCAAIPALTRQPA